MTIVKHSKDLNSQPSRKKLFPYSSNIILALFPTLLFAILLGTYLDLYFVGRELYSFPERPFADVFSIHVGFTLFILPLLTAIFLVICHKLNRGLKFGFILLLSLFMTVFEKQAESLGLFIHQDSWNHIFTFIGFNLYLLIIYSLYQGLRSHIKIL